MFVIQRTEPPLVVAFRIIYWETAKNRTAEAVSEEYFFRLIKLQVISVKLVLEVTWNSPSTFKVNLYIIRHPLETNSYAKETKYTPLSSLQELFILESKPREQRQ